MSTHDLTGGPKRLAHTMIRVRDLEASLAFYTGMLGMTLFRRQDYPDGAFTLAFVGYGREHDGAVIELTHNWGDHAYEHGSGFGHIAIGVSDVHAACVAMQSAGVTIVRPAGPMKADPNDIIAFIEDPDGFRIELVQLVR